LGSCPGASKRQRGTGGDWGAAGGAGRRRMGRGRRLGRGAVGRGGRPGVARAGSLARPRATLDQAQPTLRASGGVAPRRARGGGCWAGNGPSGGVEWGLNRSARNRVAAAGGPPLGRPNGPTSMGGRFIARPPGNTARREDEVARFTFGVGTVSGLDAAGGPAPDAQDLDGTRRAAFQESGVRGRGTCEPGPRPWPNASPGGLGRGDLGSATKRLISRSGIRPRRSEKMASKLRLRRAAGYAVGYWSAEAGCAEQHDQQGPSTTQDGMSARGRWVLQHGGPRARRSLLGAE